MIENMEPGDIVLVHGAGFISRVIEFGERIRMSKNESFWSHAAFVVNSDGDTLEATGKGIASNNVKNYRRYKVIRMNMNQIDVAQCLTYAKSMKGTAYGWLDILSIAVNILTPNIINFQTPKSLICSQFVAQCLEHGGWIIPNRTPASLVMPAMLDKYFS